MGRVPARHSIFFLFVIPAKGEKKKGMRSEGQKVNFAVTAVLQGLKKRKVFKLQRLTLFL